MFKNHRTTLGVFIGALLFSIVMSSILSGARSPADDLVDWSTTGGIALEATFNWFLFSIMFMIALVLTLLTAHMVRLQMAADDAREIEIERARRADPI